MSRTISKGRAGWAVATVLFCAALLVPNLASAAAVTPSASTGGPPQTFAYGALTWENTTTLSSAYTESVRIYVGVQVISTLTNVSSTVTELNEVYSVAESYYVQYCQPSCAAPTLSENYSESYLAVTDEWANLTKAATVHEGSTTATAYGILNVSSGYSENLTELYLGLHGSSLYYQGYYDFSYTAGTSIGFSPALGIIPATSSTGLSWTSTSAYHATGGWLESDSYYFTEPSIGYNYSYKLPAYSATDSYSGNETVQGVDQGPVTLAGGITARSIDLTYTGAYDLALGYLLTPSGNELFQGNNGWSVGISPSAIDASTVDVASSNGTNSPAVVGASASWTVGPSVPAGAPSNGTSPSLNAAPTTSGTVQAQPEPLPYAEATSRCLASGCPSSALPATPAARLGASLNYFAVGLAAAAALGAGVALMVRRRGGAPPAARIPPGAHGLAAPIERLPSEA